MLSFHNKIVHARATLDRIKAIRPDASAIVDMLHFHFMSGQQMTSPQHLVAAARFFTEPDYRAAARKVTSDFGVSLKLAERLVADALNAAPAVLKNDHAPLHEKGAIWEGDRFVLGWRGVHFGSVYHRVWRAIDIEHRPIAADAVRDAVATRRNKSLELRTLDYVALCLMQRDDRKYLELNKQSLQGGQAHIIHLRKALIYITAAARKHKISFPPSFIEDIEKSVCPARFGPIARTDVPVRRDAQRAQKDFGQKTREPGLVYDAATRRTYTKGGVRENAYLATASNENRSSDFEGHKPRAIRPE